MSDWLKGISTGRPPPKHRFQSLFDQLNDAIDSELIDGNSGEPRPATHRIRAILNEVRPLISKMINEGQQKSLQCTADQIAPVFGYKYGRSIRRILLPHLTPMDEGCKGQPALYDAHAAIQIVADKSGGCGRIFWQTRFLSQN